MDKSHEQARATRAANRAKREAQRVAWAAAEREDKALVLDALRAVLKDPEATTAQRLYAVAVLDAVQGYHFAPYGVKYPGQDVDLTKFREELDKLK